MRIQLLGAPTSDGTDIRGCELAPGRLRDLGIVDMIRQYRPVTDCGDVNVPEGGNGGKSENLTSNKIFNYNSVIDFNRALAEKAAQMAEGEDFTVFFGGDHSISMGSVAGVLYRRPDTAVIWMDAHGDINTEDTSPTHKAHGMPGAVLMGYGDRNLDPMPGAGVRLPEENLFLIGQRAFELDPGEAELIKQKGIFLRTWQDMKKTGVAAVMEEIFAALKKKNITRIHLSFDIDALDKSLVPGTGTPSEDGMDEDSAKTVLRTLASSGMLRSMDFVELNPALDAEDATARLSMGLINEIFKYLV